MDNQAQGGACIEHPERRNQHPGSRSPAWPNRDEIEDWKERFLLAAENALRARPKDEEALKDEQIEKLKQKIGDLVMDMDILKEAVIRYPSIPGTSEP